MDILSVFHILLTCDWSEFEKTSVEYLLDIRKMSLGFFMGITLLGFWRYTMPVIANTHPKGGVGKTTSSVNIVGEMKSDTVDLDTHTGLSIILGLRPEGKEISVKVPKTVDELIEIMTPYKNSDKTLLIDCGGFD